MTVDLILRYCGICEILINENEDEDANNNDNDNDNDIDNYCIYLIKRPGRLFNFWTFRVGAYRDWALIKFSQLQ